MSPEVQTVLFILSYLATGMVLRWVLIPYFNKENVTRAMVVLVFSVIVTSVVLLYENGQYLKIYLEVAQLSIFFFIAMGYIIGSYIYMIKKKMSYTFTNIVVGIVFTAVAGFVGYYAVSTVSLLLLVIFR